MTLALHLKKAAARFLACLALTIDITAAKIAIGRLPGWETRENKCNANQVRITKESYPESSAFCPFTAVLTVKHNNNAVTISRQFRFEPAGQRSQVERFNYET